MIHFNPILKPITTVNNYKIYKKPQISFCANDTFEKSYLCDYIFNDDKVISVKIDGFPKDYIYEKNQKQFFKPHYYIRELVSNKSGGGTAAIKCVVRKSLGNPLSQGRVILYSTSIVPGDYSAGFYYKLGFRFVQDEKNKIMQTWFQEDEKRNYSPPIDGTMYLPKENIEHCLNY